MSKSSLTFPNSVQHKPWRALSISLFVLITGVLGLLLIQNPLLNQSHDIRNQASTGFNATLSNMSGLVGSKPDIPESQTLIIDEANIPSRDGSDLLRIRDVFCTMDVKVCEDGSTVSRDPSRNCEFYTCPDERAQTPTANDNDSLIRTPSPAFSPIPVATPTITTRTTASSPAVIPPISSPGLCKSADITNNGKVDITDYTALMNQFMKTSSRQDIQALSGDLNCDGVVNLIDYSLLIKNLQL
jgi:hypothetical protein